MSYDLQAAQVTPPGPGTKVSYTTSSTTAQDLSAFEGRWIVMMSTTKVHIRWGTSAVGAATTSDMWITPDVEVHRWIPKGGARSFYRAIGSIAAGDLHHADASDGF